jgi:hypothetical protein
MHYVFYNTIKSIKQIMKAKKKASPVKAHELPEEAIEPTRGQSTDDDTSFFSVLGFCKYKFLKGASEKFQLTIYSVTLVFVLLVICAAHDWGMVVLIINKLRGIKWSDLWKFWKGRSP